MIKILNLKICIFIIKKSDCTKHCVLHNNRPNRKYNIYLVSNSHIELCSVNLEIQDTYWVADIYFCFQM